jgi:hypothetical protein
LAEPVAEERPSDEQLMAEASAAAEALGASLEAELQPTGEEAEGGNGDGSMPDVTPEISERLSDQLRSTTE